MTSCCGSSSASPRSAMRPSVGSRSRRRTGGASARDGRGSAPARDLGEAGRVEPGEQQRRFDLRRGDVEPVAGRDGGLDALDGQRQPVAGRCRAPIRRSGAATRSIGRRQSEASPVNSARIGWLATRPMSSRADVPRIAAVEAAPPAGAGRRRRPRRPCQAPSAPVSIRAPIARSAAAVEATSPPSFSPSIRLRPTASAASISARCEIDLSPGTRAVPRKGPRGRKG